MSQSKLVPKMTLFDLKCAAGEVIDALRIKNENRCEIVLKGSNLQEQVRSDKQRFQKVLLNML